MDKAPKTEPAQSAESARKREDKRPFLRSGFYETSDLREAAKTAYDEGMSAEELKKQRRSDWLFLVIGIPLFIGLMYLIVLLLR